MKKILTAELKRAINVGWIISILGVCFAICFDSWNDLINAVTSHEGNVHYFFWNSSIGGACRAYFLPIFAAVPFATSFCKEYNLHVLPFIVSREGKRKYCIVKYIINALCGGFVVAMAVGILILLLSTVLPTADTTLQDVMISERFHTYVAIYHPFEYGLIEIFSAFLTGILWASVALCVSLYIYDPFVVLVSPYFISFVSTQTYRIFHIADRYRLDKLLTGNVIIHSSSYTVLICTLTVVTIVFLLGFLFQRVMLRRLDDGVFY